MARDLRSIFAFLIGLAAAWALIIEAACTDPGLEWASTSLAIAAAITRIMALPAVDYLLRSSPLLSRLAPDKRT